MRAFALACALLAGAASAQVPERTEVRYTLSLESLVGLTVAEVVDTVVIADGRYEITSVATPVGMAKLFDLPGINSTSQGTVAADGVLVPESFEQIRGEKRRSVAFDHAAGVATMVNDVGDVDEVPLTGRRLVDPLTLVYMLYATGTAEPVLQVQMINGRRATEYEYSSDLQPQPIYEDDDSRLGLRYDRTDNTQRKRSVWYDEQSGYLPVRIRIEDRGVLEFRRLDADDVATSAEQ